MALRRGPNMEDSDSEYEDQLTTCMGGDPLLPSISGPVIVTARQRESTGVDGGEASGQSDDEEESQGPGPVAVTPRAQSPASITETRTETDNASMLPQITVLAGEGFSVIAKEAESEAFKASTVKQQKLLLLKLYMLYCFTLFEQFYILSTYMFILIYCTCILLQLKSISSLPDHSGQTFQTYAYVMKSHFTLNTRKGFIENEDKVLEKMDDNSIVLCCSVPLYSRLSQF